MQFKYPELLWALLTLLIPILIHLFQLRRFKKTPFTNVKLLQKVISESRRSNTLKKWLLLATRILLLAALIIAFAQPFFMETLAMKERETVIYLDDSFSMQAGMETGTLLENAVQEMIKVLPADMELSVFTNSRVFKNSTLKDIQNDLLTLPYTQQQLKLDEIYLRASTLFSENPNTLKRVVVLSDFQERLGYPKIDSTTILERHLVQLQPQTNSNISIDSVFWDNLAGQNTELIAFLSGTEKTESTPVSLFNGTKLIAKTSAQFDKNKKARVTFTLANNEIIDGKIEIEDGGLRFDDHLFFNINSIEKIKVLVLNSENADYLKRIFTADEFQYLAFSPADLNYSLLASQNVIFLNELSSISTPLQNALQSFSTDGGSLIIIPSNTTDITTYNSLLGQLQATSFSEKIPEERRISSIAFSHPLYRNVFEKEITNFQYPKVLSYYPIKTAMPPVLSFESGEPFLVGTGGTFVFTASLSAENSNFKNSPLIVPTIYNMGANSLTLPELYHILGSPLNVDIPVVLEKDKILKITKTDYEFIPMQQSFSNKVRVSFTEHPTEDGIYAIKNGETALKNISFNYPRAENKLKYLDFNTLQATTRQSNMESLFKNLEKDTAITALWKWFVILALLLVLVEVLIQKFMK